MKRTVLPTRELAGLIEASEKRLLRGFFEAAQRLRPDSGFASFEVAGGLATFMGAASPLSQTTSAGLDAPVTAETVESIIRFFGNREAPARVTVNPLGDPSLERELVKAGFVPAVRNNVLAIDATASDAARDGRIAHETDAVAWGRASARGFSDRYANAEEGTFLATTIALGTGVVPLSVRNGDGIVATAAMMLNETLASLFAASTLEGHREKGYHRAMILDRVARARESGARYARTSAPVGSTSEANFRACGFEVLYTRTTWERR